MPATIEELQGIVAGLVSVVKDLTTNVTQVNQTVGNMAEAVPAPVQHEIHKVFVCLPDCEGLFHLCHITVYF